MSAVLTAETDVRAAMREIGARARAAARIVANAPAEQKTRALTAAARILRERAPEILAANARDLNEARARGMAPAFLDRLTLSEARIEGIAQAPSRTSPRCPIPSAGCLRLSSGRMA